MKPAGSLQTLFAGIFLATLLCYAIPSKKIFAAEANWESIIDEVMSFHASGETTKAYRSLQRALDVLDIDEVSMVDDYLKASQFESLETTLMQLRRSSDALVGKRKSRAKHGVEEILLLTGLRREIEGLLKQIDEAIPSDIASLDSTDSIQGALDRSFSVPQYLAQAKRSLEELESVSRSISKAQLARLDESTVRNVADHHADLGQSLQKASKIIETQLIELHFRHIEKCVENVPDAADSFVDRVEQVRKVARSIESLQTQINTLQSGPKVQKKMAAVIDSRLAPLLVRFQKVLPLERQVAFDLEAGTRWWLRGRYGKGTARFGLLKDQRNVHHMTRADLLAQPILMPIEYPKDLDIGKLFKPDYPVISYVEAIRPHISRRHYVLWGCYAHTVQVEAAVGYFYSYYPVIFMSYALSSAANDDIAANIDFNGDEARIVGYLEYQMALAHFRRVIDTVSSEQAEEIDEDVAKDERVHFYSHVSRVCDTVFKDTPLQDPFLLAKKDKDRAGLRWMMALAQIELTAMKLGTLTDSSTNQQVSSSALASLSEFEYDAYRELLWDSARTHFCGMRYYLPTHKQQGTYKNGCLFRQLRPIDHYPLLRQEYSIALGLSRHLRDLLVKDSITTPAMLMELDGWIEYLHMGQSQLDGLLAVGPVGLYSNNNHATFKYSAVPLPESQ